jgi:hypothetical protein
VINEENILGLMRKGLLDVRNRAFPVKVILQETLAPASLVYYNDLPKLELESGDSAQTITELALDKEVHINEKNDSVRIARKTRIWISLKPFLKAKKRFVVDGNRYDQIYPPSSCGWFSRLDASGKEVTIFLHEVRDDAKFWLSIVDSTSSEIYEAHPILPHEAGILKISDEFERYLAVFQSLRNVEEAQSWLSEILAESPPSWPELAKLVSDVHIPNLRVKRNMKETMNQIVPRNYEEDIRNQIMGFLSLIVNWSIPREDPVLFFDRIYPLEVLSSLLMGYLMTILRNEKMLSYVRILQDNSQKLLATPVAALRGERIRNIWNLARHKILERIPYEVITSLSYADRLNKSGKLITRLPVSSKQALSSRKSWIDRFMLMANGFRLVSHVKPFAIGLKRLVDITRAHQWPHKHLKWSANLGGSDYREPQIQVMEMSSLAAKRVVDVRPKIVEIEWAKARFNPNLYNSAKDQWAISVRRITNSVGGERTIRKLRNEFGPWKTENSFVPKKIWAQCLDATANLGYLADLEQENYLKLLNLTPKTFLSGLSELCRKSIIDIQYVPGFVDLVSIAAIAQGPSRHLYSLARGFLKHSPSAAVNLGKKGTWLLSLLRLPVPVARRILSELPETAASMGIALTCYRALSFRSYQWDFYQRILKDDRTWDEDVSAMLSQIRLPYPDDSN